MSSRDEMRVTIAAHLRKHDGPLTLERWQLQIIAGLVYPIKAKVAAKGERHTKRMLEAIDIRNEKRQLMAQGMSAKKALEELAFRHRHGRHNAKALAKFLQRHPAPESLAHLDDETVDRLVEMLTAADE
jgi:cystathionine beta-lyase/cystathionine gamma-synthase